MMKPHVYVVTGNPGKWKVLSDNVGDLLELVQETLDTPEIQSMDAMEVATFSAKWAARELGRPVLKTDVGYHIAALGGFPGTFVKWANQMLTPEQVLAMMGDTAGRGITVREALVYAEPNGFSTGVLLVREGEIRLAGPQTGRSDASLMDKLVIEYGRLAAERSFDDFMDEISRAYRPTYRELAMRICERYEEMMRNR